jgi:hypothetical protein
MKKWDSTATQIDEVTIKTVACPAVVFLMPRFMNTIWTAKNTAREIRGHHSPLWIRRSAFV